MNIPSAIPATTLQPAVTAQPVSATIPNAANVVRPMVGHIIRPTYASLASQDAAARTAANLKMQQQKMRPSGNFFTNRDKTGDGNNNGITGYLNHTNQPATVPFVYGMNKPMSSSTPITAQQNLANQNADYAQAWNADNYRASIVRPTA